MKSDSGFSSPLRIVSGAVSDSTAIYKTAGSKGGMATLDRYGREHFARLTNGRKRIPRYSEGRRLGRRLESVVDISTRREGNDRTGFNR